MIVIALLLGSLGVADIARASQGRRTVALALGVATFTLGSLALGIGPWWAWSLVGGASIAGWLLATRGGVVADPKHRRLAQWALILLGIVVAGLWAAGAAIPVQPSAASEWLAALPYPVIASQPATVFALVLGITLFLIESGNVVVRIALAGTTRSHSGDPDVQSVREWLNPGEEMPEGLKGGRLVGQFERLFILALALAGQFTAIGAIVAAKGIVRFPEISKNDATGSKAEEFLVGSFASWSLVLVAMVLIISAAS